MFIQSITQRSTTTIYANHLIPFVCVFIIVKTPAILLVGFVLGYIMTQPAILIDPPPTTAIKDIKLIEASPDNVNKIEDGENENHNNEEDEDESSDEECIPSSSNVSLLLLDGPMSNSSIDFENLMKFPPCPTTLPRLDTHFNFIDQSPNPPIDWSAINQEIEYDQQRQASLYRKKIHHFPILSDSTPTVIKEPDTAAVFMVQDEPIIETNFSINIQDLLILPDEVPVTKPSLSSPGQLFKSKFQKAVQKMKKSSLHLDDSKRSTTTKRAASLQLNSYFGPEDPLFIPISPRPSASARVHDHFKGRLNKLFKK